MFIRPGCNEPHQDMQYQPRLMDAEPAFALPQASSATHQPDAVLVSTSASAKATPVLAFVALPASQTPNTVAGFISQLAAVPMARLTDHEQQLVAFLRRLVEQAAQGNEQAVLLLATGEKILQLTLTEPQTAKAIYTLLEQMTHDQVPYHELPLTARELLQHIDIHSATDLVRLGGILPLWQTSQAMAGAAIAPEQFSPAYRELVLPLLKASCLNHLWSDLCSRIDTHHSAPPTIKQTKQPIPHPPGIERPSSHTIATKQAMAQMLATVWKQRKQQLETEQQQRQWLDQQFQQQRQMYQHTAQWLQQLTEERQEKQQKELG